MSGPQRRHGWDRLLAATGESPFVRYEIPESGADPWWELDGAVALRRRRHRDGRPGWLLLGADAGVTGLVNALGQLASADGATPLGTPFGVTIPRRLGPLLDRHFRVQGGGDWDWFWTTSPPVGTAELAAVVPLDHVGRSDEVAAFLATHSPTADTPPGGVERWFAIENADGRLAAVTAYGSTATGAPHLSSVAVDTSLRGRGLGRTIVAAVTRLAVTEHGVCTLGMYADNTVARALYRSLGYIDACAWASRAVSLPHEGPAAGA